MNRSAPWGYLSPSTTLLKFFGAIVPPGNAVTLDLACGFGRHSILAAAYGCEVVAADRDLSRLRHLHASKSALLGQAPASRARGRITTVCADLSGAHWPFAADAFDFIIMVHFVKVELFPCLLLSLRQGGHVYFETFGGHGQNYLDLPRPGQVKAALGGECDLQQYDERAAAQRHPDAVTVKALARKRIPAAA